MTLRHDDTTLGQMTLAHLEAVVAIDSQSDEHSQTIPSSEGQRRLSEAVAETWKCEKILPQRRRERDGSL